MLTENGGLHHFDALHFPASLVTSSHLSLREEVADKHQRHLYWHCTQQLKLRRHLCSLRSLLDCGIFTCFIAYYRHCFFTVRLRRAHFSCWWSVLSSLSYLLPPLSDWLWLCFACIVCSLSLVVATSVSSRTVSGSFDSCTAHCHCATIVLGLIFVHDGRTEISWKWWGSSASLD